MPGHTGHLCNRSDGGIRSRGLSPALLCFAAQRVQHCDLQYDSHTAVGPACSRINAPICQLSYSQLACSESRSRSLITAPCSFRGELICYNTHLGRQRSTQVVLHQRVLRAQLHVAGLGGARLLRLLGDSGGLVWDRRSLLPDVLRVTLTCWMLENALRL